MLKSPSIIQGLILTPPVHTTVRGSPVLSPHAGSRATLSPGYITACLPVSLRPALAHKLTSDSVLHKCTEDYLKPTDESRDSCVPTIQTEHNVLLLIPPSSLLHLPQPLSSITCYYRHAYAYTPINIYRTIGNGFFLYFMFLKFF